MAIGSVMVDKAVILRKVQTGVVDGAPRWEEQPVGAEFRCRYTPGDETESRSESAVRRAKPATALISKRDSKGQPVNIKGTDALEIRSRRFGVMRVELTGTPTALSKRSSILAWTATLSKVVRTDV